MEIFVKDVLKCFFFQFHSDNLQVGLINAGKSKSSTDGHHMTTEKHKNFRRLTALYISMKDVETNEQAAVIEKSKAEL